MSAPYATALITGASSGLGRGLAGWFAKQGVKVYAAARRAGELEALRAELGANLVPVVLDVADADAAHARIKALDGECGGFDLVIANAGVAGGSSGKRMEWKTERQVLDVNVLGAVATLTGALPGMVARKRGHLVGVSSLAAFMPLKAGASYCASKAFLSMWLESLRLDVEPVGLRVTCLHPGYVKTALTANSKRKMPFMMETDAAVEVMAKAIVKGEKSVAFPFPLSAVAQTVAALPKGLRRLALSKVL